MKLSLTLALTVAALSPLAIAQVKRDLGSHVHGSAALNVVVVDNALIIELDTPWNNIVGFEHAPRDDAQHALVDAALDRLNQPDQLFSIMGGDCTFDALDMENALPEDQHHDNEEHHDEHDDKASAAHSTVLVSYAYNCEDVTSLKTVSIEFFKEWSGFSDLDVQLIGPGGQSLVEINADSPVVDITQVQ